MEPTNDARFSNIELGQNGNLIHITFHTINSINTLEKVTVPLLVKDGNGYRLNVDSNDMLPALSYTAQSQGSGGANRTSQKAPLRLDDVFPKAEESATTEGTKRYPIEDNTGPVFAYPFASLAADVYYGDIDGNGTVTANDALKLAKIVNPPVGYDAVAAFNALNESGTGGLDRRVLCFASVVPKPTVYTSGMGMPTEADVNAVLSVVVGNSLPEKFFEVDPAETPTNTDTQPQYNSDIDIGNNWRLKVTGNQLQFVNSDIVMAQITPIEEGTPVNDPSLAPLLVSNETMSLTEHWKIMYPGANDEPADDDSPAKQLKFVYKNYPQTIIMPHVGSIGVPKVFTDTTPNSVPFGKLWQMEGNTPQRLKFYFRSNSAVDTEPYHPQVVIGTPDAMLTRYLSRAKKRILL